MAAIQLDATLMGIDDLRRVPSVAAAADEAGFAALWSAEVTHDPFLALALAAPATRRAALGTAIATSFTRSPMSLAYTAYDLAALSEGRFMLGLGTQVKAHNERRFGVPWGPPLPRLREVIEGLRAIWQAWRTGERLNYRGEHYSFTLMTPFFTPAPHEHDIPIYIAGVNTGLCRLAGALADGFHIHPLNSPAYIGQVVRPAIAEGAAEAGRDASAVALSASVFVISGESAAERDAMRDFVRQQIAFYASTPSYRVVFETHGWEEIAERLSPLAARKQWAEMPALISDDMLHAFAVDAPPDEVGAAVRARYEGVVDRVTLYLPYFPGHNTTMWTGALAAFAG